MSNEEFERGMGALPLPGDEWEIGKTEASIRFVHEAEELVREGKLSPVEILDIAVAVDLIKQGDLEFTTGITVEEYLRQKKYAEDVGEINLDDIEE